MTDKKPKTGLELLREPFPANLIGKLPKPNAAQTDAVKRDFKAGIRCEACGQWHHPAVVHLDYVGHAALTYRLLDCDPNWNWEPTDTTEGGAPKLDNIGGMWIKLTVCGVTRLGYGHPDGKTGGNAIKEVIGDALRNAAMRFGAALDLWHKGELHVDEDTPEGGKAQPPKPDPKPAPPAPDPTPVDDHADEAKHSADCQHAIDTINDSSASTGITTLAELGGYWKELVKQQPDVARDKRVSDAKDARKVALNNEGATE